MKYTAEQYLNRIENKRLNSTPLYSREEMIDFAEKHAKQCAIPIVSNRRELLIAYELKMSSCSDEQAEIKVDSYIASVSN